MFYKDFVKIISFPSFIIFFENLITIIFKEHLSVDAPGSCKSGAVFWNKGVLGILKCHMFRIPTKPIFQNTFHLS